MKIIKSLRKKELYIIIHCIPLCYTCEYANPRRRSCEGDKFVYTYAFPNGESKAAMREDEIQTRYAFGPIDPKA